MDSLGITLAIKTLQAIAFVCDILTFPVYVLFQRPWRVRSLSRRVKAIVVNVEYDNEKELNIDVDGDKISNGDHFLLKQLRNSKVLFTYIIGICVKRYANKKCLGTRQIKAEEDEVQANGRIFKKYVMGDYMWKTFAEVDMLATNFGKGVRELGNKPKENIVIFAETRAEWMIAAQGLFKQSIPVVTIYATLGDDAIIHSINETEVATVITIKTVIYIEDQLKKLDNSGYKGDVEIIPFNSVLKLGSESKISNCMPLPNDVAIIMYTSGSTGVPKGVIIVHSNLVATLKAFSNAVTIRDDDCLIAFLPLAHVFELLVESVCLCMGVSIGYSTPLTMIDSSSKIKKGTKGDASVLRPTCMTSVPLILDRISKGIQEKVSKGSSITKALFKFSYDYKTMWTRRGYSTPLVDKIVFGKIRQMLGGRIRLVISGGAPLSPDTHEQINNCLCINIIQGYGLTETTSCATIMDRFDMSVGRVGGPATVCDIKLVNWEEGHYRITDKPYPRGEIVVGGDCISVGYYKLPDKTKDEFFEADGKRWFKTGDICEIHGDGVVKIIDRKKDLVKLQAGEYVSLGKVETELKTCPIVDNVCIYGDSSKQYCVALVVPNQTQLNDLATKHGIANKSFDELCSLPKMEKAVLKELLIMERNVNWKNSKYRRL
ncbi:hypothetical protein RI129_004204 [Pyrocoelia pectoralis]|uniref:long-chain-fatty-acid--CoA ligase n=1 Tax=Pyrocoelia pectoralis TaxID=417401 RepID=A0AAN7ZGM1_9COLE